MFADCGSDVSDGSDEIWDGSDARSNSESVETESENEGSEVKDVASTSTSSSNRTDCPCQQVGQKIFVASNDILSYDISFVGHVGLCNCHYPLSTLRRLKTSAIQKIDNNVT